MQRVLDELRDVDRLVFQSPLVAIGAFRCAPHHPRFEDSGPIRNHCVVFPRTAARIEHDDGRSFVGNQAVVSLYNAGQRYRRARVSREGDCCDYFSVDAGVLRDALAVRSRRAAEAPAERLFVDTHASSSATLYLRQRRVFQAVSTPGTLPVDPLAVEGEVLRVVEAVLDGVPDLGSAAPERATRRPDARHRDIVDAAEVLLARHFDASWTLADIAGRIGSSPYHLCRIYRRHTGRSLHQFRDQLRLRAALNRLEDGVDLSTVALEVGYSSHSHFTAAFRRAFGVPPQVVRRTQRIPHGERVTFSSKLHL